MEICQGLTKEILKPGIGQETPKSGATVSVHYKGSLENGTVFDESNDRDGIFKFKLGTGQVIKGWEKAIATMKAGELSKFRISPDLAYGVRGYHPNIPPNSTLIFEIELVNFLNDIDLTKDGGVIKKIIEDSKDFQLPSYESKCIVQIRTTSIDGLIEYEPLQTKEITIGDDIIPEGLEKALESMKINEKSVFTVKSNYAYGETGNLSLKIGPNTDLVYHIEMKSFQKELEYWQMDTFTEKLEAAIKRKNEGNNFFGTDKFNSAERKYKKSLEIFNYEHGLADNEKEIARKEIKLPCYLNLSACHIKTKHYKQAIEDATKGLEIDPKSVKGLWRKGCAFMELGEWENSKQSFQQALDIEPENKSVKTSFAQLKKKMADQDLKEKKAYQKFFT